MDAQPTLAPDGAALVLLHRPLSDGEATHPKETSGASLDTATCGVSRASAGRSQPQREHLGPSLAADGSLYFMDRVDGKGPFKLWRRRRTPRTC